MQAAVWTVPASRMKAGKDHRVPLSEPALAILHDMSELRVGDAALVFPGASGRKPLSDVALSKLLSSRATVHGFRSTFRTYAGECTTIAREVVEQALAHRTGDAVEQAYARGDLFQRRASLMAAWGQYASGKPVGAEVVPLLRPIAAVA
jgi:integrase